MHCVEVVLGWSRSPINTPSGCTHTHAGCELHARVRPNKYIPPTSPTTNASINRHAHVRLSPSSLLFRIGSPNSAGHLIRSATTFLLSTFQPLRSRPTFHIRSSPCFPRACPCHQPVRHSTRRAIFLLSPRYLAQARYYYDPTCLSSNSNKPAYGLSTTNGLSRKLYLYLLACLPTCPAVCLGWEYLHRNYRLENRIQRAFTRISILQILIWPSSNSEFTYFSIWLLEGTYVVCSLHSPRFMSAPAWL
ncbi:hypothetical protein BKA64DRAFT_215968 [Cadophora sp. MPI-SDFR-AT-0126]|nr:hypothetical protein BKA64DRAFT_215968 [Leotiomycetes sp. MPI-SDFR-AT-0126]